MRCIALALMIGCGSSKTDMPATSTATGSGSAQPSASTEKTIETRSFDLGGKLALTVTAPACAKVTIDETYGTALLGPSEPGCPLPAGTIRIEPADDSLGTAATPAELVTRTLGGTNPIETKTSDGLRIDYEMGSRKGLLVHRTVGGRVVSCRGDGRDRELKVVEAVCASLAAK